MTEKELLYIEDALNHCKFIQTQLENAASSVKEKSLKNTLESISKANEQTYLSFFSLVGGTENE